MPFRVALTFDAEHPRPASTAPGATTGCSTRSRRPGRPATFFVQGRWAEAYPAVARDRRRRASRRQPLALPRPACRC